MEYEIGKKIYFILFFFIFLECDKFQLDWHRWIKLAFWNLRYLVSFQILYKCSFFARESLFSRNVFWLNHIKSHSQCFAFSFLQKQLVLYARKELKENIYYYKTLFIIISSESRLRRSSTILWILRYTDLLTNLRDFVQISCSAFLTYSFLILSGEGRIAKRAIQNIWRTWRHLSQNDLYFSMIKAILIIRRFGIYYIGSCVSENTWYIYITQSSNSIN